MVTKFVAGRAVRKRLPLPEVRSDLRDAGISDAYLRKLLGGFATPPDTARGLPDSPYLNSRPFETFLRLTETSKTHLSQSRSVAVDDRDLLTAIATETILCGIGSVLRITPTTFATYYDMRSNAFMELLCSTDYVIVDDLFGTASISVMQSSPVLLAAFDAALQVLCVNPDCFMIYGFHGMTGLYSHAHEALTSAYGTSAANLIMSDLTHLRQ